MKITREKEKQLRKEASALQKLVKRQKQARTAFIKSKCRNLKRAYASNWQYDENALVDSPIDNLLYHMRNS